VGVSAPYATRSAVESGRHIRAAGRRLSDLGRGLQPSAEVSIQRTLGIVRYCSRSGVMCGRIVGWALGERRAHLRIVGRASLFLMPSHVQDSCNCLSPTVVSAVS
jgi:hypothetical protein